MGIPPILNVCRHDADNRALVTLTGEIDLQSVPRPRPSKCLRREPTALAALSRAPGHAPARPGAGCSPGRCAATALAGPIRSRGRADHQPFTTHTTPLSQGRLNRRQVMEPRKDLADPYVESCTVSRMTPGDRGPRC